LQYQTLAAAQAQTKEPSDDAATKLKGKAAPAIKLSTADGGAFDLADSKDEDAAKVMEWSGTLQAASAH
jgi:hypothetical protein